MRVFLAAVLLFAGPSAAEPVSVAADIAPVQSLVARVMEGVGEPTLVIEPGASPHTYAMRPSQAAALERADVVFWIGEGLTPWLEAPLAALAGDSRIVGLLDYGRTIRYGFRDSIGSEPDHGHGNSDPHAWLDPENGKIWLDLIAETLSVADPVNADAYRGNAAKAIAETDALEVEMRSEIGSTDRPHAVYHDAYQYFERRFGLTPAFALTTSEAVSPGPARIAALRAKASEDPPACVFREPKQDTRLIGVVFDGADIPVLELDPIGAKLEPGPRLYWELLRGMALSFGDCS